MAKKSKFKIDIGKAINRLDIEIKRNASAQAIGFYKSAFRGQGLEFEEYANYGVGEDASNIDWKASGRSTSLLVKRYIEERNLKVFFLVDVSSSMIFGSGIKLKNEYAAELILSLSHSMIEAGDEVGFALFNENVTKKLKPAGGKPQYYQITKALVNPDFYGGGYNFIEALNFVKNFLDDEVLLIIVSDFIGLKGNWEEKVKLIANRFDIIAMMIRDPRDLKLPSDPGQVVVEDPHTGEQTLIEPNKIRKLYSKINNQQIIKIKKAFVKNNCDFIDFYTDKPYITRVISFFKMRAFKVT
ncbi:DUF58 domain-containing protein [Candidatus Woesearchaeota archaeon]|nr:DUF58 domain-containing protein [Candidatus Woesearchaeota archaeon]